MNSDEFLTSWLIAEITKNEITGNDPTTVPVIITVVFLILFAVGIGVGIKLYRDQVGNVSINSFYVILIEHKFFKSPKYKSEKL